MKASGNTILITGGGTGIGLALAARFLQRGNEVVICGRRLEALNEARRQYPQLHVYQCDLSQESARLDLFEKVTRDFPGLNAAAEQCRDVGFDPARSSCSNPGRKRNNSCRQTWRRPFT